MNLEMNSNKSYKTCVLCYIIDEEKKSIKKIIFI